MTSRRVLAGLTLGALVFTASACSDTQSSADSTTSSTSSTTSTSTTVAESTTSSSSSTTSSTSTTTTSTTTAPTTSTIPPTTGLGLSDQGLGDVLFGAEADGVVDYVSGILGTPTNDSGWVDPLTIGAACTGTTVRFVAWNDLSLFFTDDSPAATGLKHFAGYTYGPPVGEAAIQPFGLTTDNGVGVGASVQFLRAMYPKVQVSPGDDIGGPSFFLSEGLSGFLTGTSNKDTIMSFVGGYGCGE